MYGKTAHLCRSGRMRASVATLERLVHAFPDDVSLKNDLGVAHLLLGDNTGAKKVYEQVCVLCVFGDHRVDLLCLFLIGLLLLSALFFQVLATAPHNGFAKVHYGFILKSENKIEESIPYLKVNSKTHRERERDAGQHTHVCRRHFSFFVSLFSGRLGVRWAGDGRWTFLLPPWRCSAKSRGQQRK